MSDNDTLSPVEMLALSRLFDPRTDRGKRVREEVSAGRHDFDFQIRVQGHMDVREDYTSRIVAKAQPWTLLMLLADKVNANTLNALVRQAAEIDKNDPRIEEFKARVNEAMQEIKAPTETECKGSVKAEALVTPVGQSTRAA